MCAWVAPVHPPCAACLKVMFDLKGQLLPSFFPPSLIISHVFSNLSPPAHYFQSFYRPKAPSLAVSFRDERSGEYFVLPLGYLRGIS